MAKISIVILILVCIAFFLIFLCLYRKKDSANAVNESTALTVWQIDSFEGGKGSRAEFLQKLGNEFSKKESCYINVVSLSADAARLNLHNGNAPDIISYGAGMYGIESYVSEYSLWCRGSYCLFSLDTNSDFSDVTDKNTVINKGKDNFSNIAALFCGLQNAKVESSTGAYVKLINGEYKYLLGTQRDIFRLKTRDIAFSVKPITIFNDLYQAISITTKSESRAYAQKYIDYILSKSEMLSSIGMFMDGIKLYDNEMSVCENIIYEYKITYPINEETKAYFERCVSLGNINMLKEALK